MAIHCNQGTERLGNKACEVAGSTDMSDTAQPVTSVRTFDCNATQLLLLHLVFFYPRPNFGNAYPELGRPPLPKSMQA